MPIKLKLQPVWLSLAGKTGKLKGKLKSEGPAAIVNWTSFA